MAEPRISVIIPVKNGADKIGQCLSAVFAQSCKAHEVILVDGHSSDGTVEEAKKFPAKIIFEDYHTRAGACKVGIANSEGEFVAFTDADCIPDKDWLASLAKELTNGIVGAGGIIKNVGDEFWVRSVNHSYSNFLGSANSVQGRLFTERRFVRSISGCNSMYRRTDILRAGGFKTELRGAEDADLNSRMSRLGKLLYTPEAVVYHDHGRGLRKFGEQMFRYGRDRGVAKRWGLQAAPPLVAPFLLLTLIATPWVIVCLMAIYALVVLTTGLRLAIRERDVRFVFSIPIVYLTEHILYSLGLWRGLVLGK